MFFDRAFRAGITAFARGIAIPHYQRRLRRFETMLGQARAMQKRALMEKLSRCADTRFGRDHGFSDIRTVEDYRRRVPISQYEYIEPYIRDVSEGKIQALFPSSEEVLAFGCTSGTSGERKLNPVTRTWLREYRRSWEVWGIKAITDHSEVIGRRMLQLTGPANLGKTKSGLSMGMISAVAVRYQSRLIRSFYSTPLEVADLPDPLTKYYTILRLALTQQVGMIVAITPANLIRLAESGNEYRERLIRDIHDGTLRSDINVPPEFRQRIAREIGVKRPDRARELERIIERTGALYPKDYWPLSFVTCWLGGTIGYQARNLPKFYGNTPARDLGLVSTEGRHTTPLVDDRPDGVLAVDGNYYEFVPVEEMGRPDARVFECHELEPGHDYFLIMTTSSGLYRYDIGDVVRCVGFMGQAPLLEFLHKDDNCADLEGEKISGHQVAYAVETATRELGLKIDCFTAVPVRPEGEPPYYSLLLETQSLVGPTVEKSFLEIVDRELVRQNVMYAGKRSDRYLQAPRLHRLHPGAWAEYVAREVLRRGTDDSQYKHPALVADPAWLERLAAPEFVEV
jgi:GH3 auxin-responsive promoter